MIVDVVEVRLVKYQSNYFHIWWNTTKTSNPTLEIQGKFVLQNASNLRFAICFIGAISSHLLTVQ